MRLLWCFGFSASDKLRKEFAHILLMGSRPIDPLALSTLEEFFLLMKDKVWNISLCFLPGDLIEKGVTKEAPAKELLFIEQDMALLNQLPELVARIVFRHPEDPILRPSGNELCVSRQDHPAIMAGRVKQLVKIIPSIVEGIVPQHSQTLCQFSQHPIRYEFHQTRPR